MDKSDLIIVLDIGTTKICAIAGRINEYNKVEILGMSRTESIGVMRGVVTNISQTVEAIERVLDEVREKVDEPFDSAYVGIAGQHISSLQHRDILTREHLDEEITLEDIDILVDRMHKIVLPPGDRIIHVLPQEFIIDNEQGIKQPVGMAGVRLEANFHIITGQIAAARNINRCVEKANLKVQDLILEPLASADAVLSAEEKEAGVALVDIGGGTTDIAIFQDGIIRHTAVIPLGGNIVTEDIKEGCMIMKRQAETLKVKFGSALALEAQENEIVSIPGLRGRQPKEISLRNLAHIIQARMEEILEQVHFEIRHSGFEKKLIGGIVLTGGGSQLKHIVQLAEYVTGLDARIGYPTEHLAQGDNKEIRNPMYSTGIGLLIRGHKDQLEMARKAQGKDENLDEQTEEMNEEILEEVPVSEEDEETKNPVSKRVSWYIELLRKGKKWFDDSETPIN